MEQPQIIEHVNHSLNWTVFGARWIPRSARFVAFGQHPRATGALEVCKLSGGKVETQAKFEKPDGFKCGTFKGSSLEERRFATGSFKGGLDVWDLERMDRPTYSARQHEGIINCIDGVGGRDGISAPELVTGGRDGCVKVWDVRQPDAPVADMAPSEENPRDCWAVAFGNSFDEERCVAAGYDNGDVKLFDLRAMKTRWETNLPNGVVSLQFDRQDIAMNKLCVTGLESKFRVYDMKTYNEDSGYASVAETAHKSTVWCGEHMPQDRDIFMTGGGNGSLYLWKYRYPAKRWKEVQGKKEGVAGTVEMVNNAIISTQPINCFDWSPDKRGLCLTTGFDQAVRVCIVTNTNTI